MSDNKCWAYCMCMCMCMCCTGNFTFMCMSDLIFTLLSWAVHVGWANTPFLHNKITSNYLYNNNVVNAMSLQLQLLLNVKYTLQYI